MSEITVRLFGAFRNMQDDPEIQVAVPASALTLADFRTYLRICLSAVEPSFDALGLLEKSVIANDKSVLEDTDLVESGDRLALLPPVSGG